MFINAPVTGSYRATASGSAGSSYAIDFTVLSYLPAQAGGNPATTNDVSGTIGSSGSATTTFTVGDNGVGSSPGQAPSVTAAAGSGQSTATGTRFPHPLIATVTDSHGRPVPGLRVTFAVTAGSAAFSGRRPHLGGGQRPAWRRD